MPILAGFRYVFVKDFNKRFTLLIEKVSQNHELLTLLTIPVKFCKFLLRHLLFLFYGFMKYQKFVVKT